MRMCKLLYFVMLFSFGSNTIHPMQLTNRDLLSQNDLQEGWEDLKRVQDRPCISYAINLIEDSMANESFEVDYNSSFNKLHSVLFGFLYRSTKERVGSFFAKHLLYPVNRELYFSLSKRLSWHPVRAEEKDVTNVEFLLDMDQQIQDKNLMVIWPKIVQEFARVGNLVPAVIDEAGQPVLDSAGNVQSITGKNATADNIRIWFENKARSQEIQDLMQKVTKLNFNDCDLTYLPSELSSFVNLQELDLGRNRLTFIDVLSHFKNLKTLTLCGNQIKLIDPLSKLVNLELLDLSYSQLTSIEKLTHFVNLKALNLGGNRLESVVIEEGCLPNLETLDLNNNPLRPQPAIKVPSCTKVLVNGEEDLFIVKHNGCVEHYEAPRYDSSMMDD